MVKINFNLVRNAWSICFLLAAFHSAAQGWIKQIGDDVSSASVLQAADGGYITTSQPVPVVGFDVKFTKWDANGDSLWSAILADTLVIGLRSIHRTQNGYVVTASYHAPPYGNNEGYILKTDTDFNPIWDKKEASVSLFNEAFVLSTGEIVALSGRAGGAYLMKLNNAGDTLWTQTIPITSIMGFASSSIRETDDGGFILTGYTWRNNDPYVEDSAYLIKTDNAGNLQWKKNVTTGQPANVRQCTDLGYVIGMSSGPFRIIKTDASGNIQWTKTGNGSIYDVEIATDGEIVYAYGYLYGTFIKLGNDGTERWTRSFNAKANDIDVTADSAFVLIADNSYTSTNYLIKTDSEGNAGSTTAREVIPTGLPLKVFPNPSDEFILVELNTPVSVEKEFTLIDISGKEVKQQCFHENSLQVPTKDLEPGMYLYKVVSGSSIGTGRLIVNH